LTFDLRAILVFVFAAAVYAGLLKGARRQWAIMLASVVAIYWLQPPLPIRFSDFILPTATIALTVITWLFTRQKDSDEQASTASQDRITLLLIFLLVVGLSFMRYIDADYRITASRSPSPVAVLTGLLLLGGLVAIGLRMGQARAGRRQRDMLIGLILLVVALFILLKTEALASGAARWWRVLTGQDTTLASPVDLAWLGFSFVAFRLIHTLRDRQVGILPAMSLLEYVSYVIFFPAYIAGPIDRAERFVTDFRALPALAGLDVNRLGEGVWRITLGLLKKFVIADSLAQGMALTATNAQQANSSLGLWLLLYGYALRLYFDFAGYSDVAIGFGILFGIRLPENFHRPYLRTNITEFWQSWHMTLSNWVRSYVFIPLSRWLLRRSWRPSSTLIVLVAQMATMIVIGLWHGFTWNFFIWGVWHGLALFVHKLWSDRSRNWQRRLTHHPNRKRAWSLVSWYLTFQYVVLGWVWFALPSVDLSLKVYAGLFGLGD